MNGDREAQFWGNMRTAKEDDTISRQMALDKIAEYFGGLPIVVHHDMLQIIKDLPPAQPERKTGRWEEKPDPYGFFDTIPVCSECGCTTKMREKTRYCPHCGADMRGGVDGADGNG